MIVCSAALKAHLAKSGRESDTNCTAWLTQKVNGEVVGFCEHISDFTFDLEAWMAGVSLAPIPGVAGTGSVLYNAAAGHSRTDIATSAALDIDNLEATGLLRLPSLVEADVNAGLWDAARVTLFLVNWADLSMGALIYRSGTLGEITIDRGHFRADLLGIALAYQNIIGKLTTPGCPWILGDAHCKFVLGSPSDSPSSSFAVSGTLTGVSTDQRTLFDTARTEPGPTGGVDIIAVTNANPGVVTTTTPLGLIDGSPIIISGVLGMLEINTTTVFLNPSGNDFDLSVDTSGFEVYTSGGSVIPLGEDSGWFDHGVITITSGANAGLSMEVQAYAPGVIALELPFPYPLVGNETYTMVAGCDKSFNTCKTKFDNVVNFGGFPYLPGMDKLLQVGKQ